jgi:ectoine hydroxylase-related dioxygenase (phytanoyl-CoA dioxygenase family)
MLKVLTSAQIQSYQEDGVLFPLPALSDTELQYFRSCHDELDRLLGGQATAQQKGECHLHYNWACDLATHPRILDAVEDVIGPDILIHSSTVFAKYPGDQRFISWHQDSFYWRLSEPRLVSAWIALTDSGVENGCMRVLPGTHRRRYEHIEQRHQNNILGKGLTVSEELDFARAVNVVLKAGEMSFHHANIIHGSQPNISTQPRIGYAVRYVSTDVSQKKPHHAVILARGHDQYGFYCLQEKPTAGIEQGLIVQRAFENDPEANRR